MQLKLKRSQRAGSLTGTAIFCIDARADLTAEEQQSVHRYRLGKQVIYSSEGAKQAAANSALSAHNAKTRGINVNNVDDFLFSATDTLGHGLKAVALGALSKMRLNITINSLQDGHHIECKSLDELLGAEEGIMTACRNLAGYLETAASFDGREVVIDFSQPGEPVIASAAPIPQLSPSPILLQSIPVETASPLVTARAAQTDRLETAPTESFANVLSVDGVSGVVASLADLDNTVKGVILIGVAFVIFLLTTVLHFPVFFVVALVAIGTGLAAKGLKLF